MIWIRNEDWNVRWADNKHKFDQITTHKDSKYTNSHTETFEEASSKASETLFTWNDSKQLFDWSNSDNVENLYSDSIATNYNCKNYNSSSSSVSDFKSKISEVQINGKLSKTSCKHKVSSREEKKLQYYEELFKRQEARNAKKKLKNWDKKSQKPQETKVYRKRGRKPKNQQKSNKVFIKALPEFNNSNEWKIELIQTIKYFDMAVFRNPKVNFKYERFGSFEKQHNEIRHIWGEKNSKARSEDYHDHSTFNDNISNSTNYMTNSDISKLASFDKVFKVWSSSSNIQNLNKFAIDFESQHKLKDDYWSKLLEMTKSAQNQEITSQMENQLKPSSFISVPSIKVFQVNDINQEIVKNRLNLLIEKDSKIHKKSINTQDEYFNSHSFNSLSRLWESQVHKPSSSSDCKPLVPTQLPEFNVAK